MCEKCFRRLRELPNGVGSPERSPGASDRRTVDPSSTADTSQTHRPQGETALNAPPLDLRRDLIASLWLYRSTLAELRVVPPRGRPPSRSSSQPREERCRSKARRFIEERQSLQVGGRGGRRRHCSRSKETSWYTEPAFRLQTAWLCRPAAADRSPTGPGRAETGSYRAEKRSRRAAERAKRVAKAAGRLGQAAIAGQQELFGRQQEESTLGDEPVDPEMMISVPV